MKEKYYIKKKTYLATEKKCTLHHYLKINKLKPWVLISSGGRGFKKCPLNLWWISNKTIMEVGNITKARTFNSFLHLTYKKTQILFFVTVFKIFFMRQILTDDFWGLYKNMNCTFPLTLIRIFWKTKTFFKKLEHYFLVETTKIEAHHFHSKLFCQKAMLRQIEWRLSQGVEFCQ